MIKNRKLFGNKYVAKAIILAMFIPNILSNKPPECTISKDSLNILKNKVNNILASAFSKNDKKTCTANLNGTDNCNEVTNLILCGVQHLKNGLMNASYSGSIEEVIKLKNAYADLLDKYEEQKDYLGPNLSQEGNKPQLDELKVVLQELALVNLQITNIHLCVSEILQGKTEEALEHYKNLKSIPISQIIEQSYNFQNGYDELKKFENIINFIKKQPIISNDIICYETLYKEMDAKNDLNNLKIILLANGIRNSPAKNNLTSLYSNVDNYLSKIKESWANAILNKRKDENIESFANNYDDDFRDILSETLETAFKGNGKSLLLEDFDYLMEFIRDFPYIPQCGVAYMTVFDEMKKRNLERNTDYNQVTKLAYSVKTGMEQANYPNIDDKYKEMFEYVKRNIPTWAKKIIWDKCKLKNRLWGQYLYADGTYVYDNERRHVFTWQKGTPEGIMEAESQWKFEARGQGDFFVMKNVRWKEYLYAASDLFAYNQNRRSVYTWRNKTPVSQGHWKIAPIDDDNYISLLNTLHNEYLYVDGAYERDSFRRQVFTWRPKKLEGIMVQEAQWELECD